MYYRMKVKVDEYGLPRKTVKYIAADNKVDAIASVVEMYEESGCSVDKIMIEEFDVIDIRKEKGE